MNDGLARPHLIKTRALTSMAFGNHNMELRPRYMQARIVGWQNQPKTAETLTRS